MTARHASAECFHSESFQSQACRVEREIEDWIRAQGRRKITRLDVEQGTGIKYNSVSGRVNSLMSKRLVFETGEYVVNESTGKRAAVLRHRDNMAGMQGVLL